jgi:hypothetical protein
MIELRSFCGVLALTALSLGAGSVLAQGRIAVGQGAVFDSGGGRIAAGCANLLVHGQVGGRWGGLDSVRLGAAGALSTRSLDFGGDWHSQTEQTVPGEVHWQPQCGRREGTLTGDHRFAQLAITGDSGVTRRLAVDSEQVIEQSLRLEGDSTPLLLRSSMPGQAARLTVASAARWQVEAVDVADIDASGGQSLAPGNPANYRSRDSGGNRNWFLAAVSLPLPVPLLGPAGLVLMALLMLLAVWQRSRRMHH